MTKIKCNVINCRYNEEKECALKEIDIKDALYGDAECCNIELTDDDDDYDYDFYNPDSDIQEGIVMKKKEISSSLKSLLEKLESEGIEVDRHQKAALIEVINEYCIDKSPMSAYTALENWLYMQDDKPVDIKSAMIWGGLWVVHQMRCIEWGEMKNMYGDFMSKQMKLQ